MNIMKEWFSCRRSASSHRNVPLVGRSPHDGIRHCRRLAQLGGAGLVMLPVLVAASACSSSTATVHVLDWGVLDHTTNVETNVAGGGSITVNPDDTLYVTLRVQDPTGIKSMSVSADGMFSCRTPPDQNDVTWTAPDPLPAGTRLNGVYSAVFCHAKLRHQQQQQCVRLSPTRLRDSSLSGTSWPGRLLRDRRNAAVLWDRDRR